MSKTKAWISAMRLRTLPLSLSGIIIGSASAHFNDFWDTKIFVFALLTTVLFQILSNFANDLGDSLKGTDNDNRVGPERAVQSGVISPLQMKQAVILTSLLSLLSAGYLIFISAQNMTVQTIYFYVGLALLSIVAAITYTVGKKAYGYNGLGDLMVLFFFGGVSVLGVYSLYTNEFNWANIYLAFFVGLLSTAVLNLNNMRDYQNDFASGKNTLVVKMGPNYAKFYHALLIVIGLASLALFINELKTNILYTGMIPGFILFVHLRKVMQTTIASEFDPELKKVALVTFSISIFTSIALFLS